MKSNSEYKTAIYLRLSKEDSRNKGESESISNQRTMLQQYASQNGFIVIAEYVDDGVSGTTFKREGFQQLLADIDKKKIDNILIKDLSRLGRNYLETGELHKKFVLQGIRLIAVASCYDNINAHPTMFIMQDVINDLYVRDTSEKIKNTLQAKMREGAFIGAFAPYGYKKDKNNKNKLVVDITAQVIVRKIFKLACDGLEPYEIAKILNGAGVLSPSLYRCQTHPHLAHNRVSKVWRAGAVYKILNNRVYLGHMVQGKTTTKVIRTPKCQDKSEWIVIENTHEPIVDIAVFDKANMIMRGRRRSSKYGFCNMFHGIAVCAACGKAMSSSASGKKGEVYDLVCGGYKLNGTESCASHRIGYQVLSNIVLDALRKQLRLTAKDKQEIIYALESSSRKKKSCQTPEAVIREIDRRQQQLMQKIKQVYEDYEDCILNADMKNGLLADYNNQLKNLKATRVAYQQERKEMKKEVDIKQKYQQLLKQYTDIQELTREIVGAFVERIEIEHGDYSNRTKHKEQTVKIMFRFTHKPMIYSYKL